MGFRRRSEDLGPRNGGRALARRARELAEAGKRRPALVRAGTAYDLLTEDCPTPRPYATADAFVDCAAAFTAFGDHGMAFRCLIGAVGEVGRVREDEPENGIAHARFGMLGYAAYTSGVAGGLEAVRLVDILEFTVTALTTGMELGAADPATVIEAATALADRYEASGRHDDAAALRRLAAGTAAVE